MFGYRVQFNRNNMFEDKPDPNACQMHKPIHKFAQDILLELTKGYEQIQKYHTLQKIIIPVHSESQSDADENEIDKT